MKFATRCAAMLALGLGLCHASSMAAPIFQCSNGAWSNQRCARDTPSLQVYGPAVEVRPQRSSPPVYGGRLQPPVRHIEYLSPECQRLSEALRTAPARGVGNDVTSDLRRAWADTCQENDALARQQYQAKVGDKREAERAARDASNATVAAQKIESSRCLSMYGLMRERRARLDSMNPAEQREFHEFEANVRARCPLH